MPPFFPPLVLAVADASAISADNPMFAYAVGAVVMGGIITTVMVADRIDSMLQRRRRQPSVDVDLVGLQAAIKTLTATVDDLKKAQADHHGHKEKIAGLEEKCGRLEREATAFEASQRSYTAKLTREWFERIETLERTVSSNFKEVERGLGKVEGALEQLTARLNS